MDKMNIVEKRIFVIKDSLKEAKDLFSRFSTEAIDIATGDAGEEIVSYSHRVENHFLMLEHYIDEIKKACHDHDRRVKELGGS